jgi:hypothetical protein
VPDEAGADDVIEPGGALPIADRAVQEQQSAAGAEPGLKRLLLPRVEERAVGVGEDDHVDVREHVLMGEAGIVGGDDSDAQSLACTCDGSDGLWDRVMAVAGCLGDDDEDGPRVARGRQDEGQGDGVVRAESQRVAGVNYELPSTTITSPHPGS